ncbi:MAG: SGNH/GDSL hydrolase family protein [bacterium]
MIVLLGAMMETASYFIWKTLVPTWMRKNVITNTIQNVDQYHWIPNAFWHHDLNPRISINKLNSKGIRGEDFKIPKPERELRIICIGDSTVEGCGVKYNLNKTFSYLLADRLKPVIKKSSRYDNVRVINAGISSHNSAFSLALLEYRLLNYQPDIIIIKSSFNDYIPYAVPGMKYDYTHAFPEPFTFDYCRSPYWLAARYSYFFKTLGCVIFRKEIRFAYKKFLGEVDQTGNMDFSSNKDKFYIYGENIRSMILLCKGRNIKVFILDLPPNPDPKTDSQWKYGRKYKNLIRHLDKELKRITAEEKVPFVETIPFLKKEDYTDYCHTRESGHRKIADKLFDALIRNKVLASANGINY